MKATVAENFFYHIYPLGLCGCPRNNDFCQPAGTGLSRLTGELETLRNLGVTALYIGPLFESTAHGYDTVDYFWVDRRLGTNDDLKAFVLRAHELGMKVVLDAVFNHTGRHFFAFRDLQEKGRQSQYRDWYLDVNFESDSPYHDGFSYANWAGCNDLVKLNLRNPAVQEHLLAAVTHWITDFGIDGLRLDAADVMDFDFQRKLRAHCCSLDPDFWLMGEVVHGDYRQWVNESMLHSVTNYQLHKGLWSSFNDRNFFEVAWTLKQQFASGGTLENQLLYNFLDNHDVNRVASVIKDSRHLIPLYGLLFTVPGIPSVYYGSQWGLRGQRDQTGDYQLRPCLPPFSADMPEYARPDPAIPYGALENAIRTYGRIRKENQALQKGSYREISVTNTLFVFEREFFGAHTLVLCNCEAHDQQWQFQTVIGGTWRNLVTGENLQLGTGGGSDRITVPADATAIYARV